MARLALIATLVISACAALTAQGPAPHAYFDALKARPEHWKSQSFRDGTLESASIRYDAAMDAAKITIPAFRNTSKASCVEALDATSTQCTVTVASPTLWPSGRILKIDSEVVVITSRALPVIFLARGQHGTTPAIHAAGAPILHSSNTVPQNVHVPLNTVDGHRYFFTWDVFWSDSYLGVDFSHKTYQFTSGGNDLDGSIWFELQSSYAHKNCPTLGLHQIRTYQQAGGPADWSASTGDQLGPNTTRTGDKLGPGPVFCFSANRWVRYFFEFNQRANDYDPVNAWIADEQTDPLQILSGALVSVRPQAKLQNQIINWVAEWNSSSDALHRLDQRDFVSYMRNLVVLRDVADVTPLLIRPLAGAPQPPVQAPTSIRVVTL